MSLKKEDSVERDLEEWNEAGSDEKKKIDISRDVRQICQNLLQSMTLLAYQDSKTKNTLNIFWIKILLNVRSSRLRPQQMKRNK